MALASFRQEWHDEIQSRQTNEDQTHGEDVLKPKGSSKSSHDHMKETEDESGDGKVSTSQVEKDREEKVSEFNSCELNFWKTVKCHSLVYSFGDSKNTEGTRMMMIILYVAEF